METIVSSQNQATIARPVRLCGISANDFRDCVAEIRPAPANHGIVFRTPQGPVRACIANLCRQERHHTTSLRNGEAHVRTVEHLLSALYGLGIDNAAIELKRCGIPFRDFSADWFCRLIVHAGVRELPERRRLAKITERETFFGPGGETAILSPTPHDRLTVECHIDFPDPIGKATVRYDSGDGNYADAVAPARSFMSSPLADGDSDKWERVRSIYPILPEDPSESPLITYTEGRFLTPLRFPNEPATHKLLDFLGDISLLGLRLAGRVEVYRPGHRFTAETVARMAP